MTIRRVALIVLALVGAAAVALFALGRTPICTCGYVKFWHGVTMSPENSQHFSDWYSFSHITHGFLFYTGIWFLLRDWSLRARFLIGTAIECAWEVFENTDFIINRYRAATISLDYFGDSIINSVSDIGMTIIGLMLAARFPWKVTVAAGVALELFTGLMIRDNLALNVLMLIWPLDAVKQWQASA